MANPTVRFEASGGGGATRGNESAAPSTIAVVWPTPEWAYFSPQRHIWVAFHPDEQFCLEKDNLTGNTQRVMVIDGVPCAIYAAQKVLHHPNHGVIPVRRQDRGQERGPYPTVAWATRAPGVGPWEFLPPQVSGQIEEVARRGDKVVNVAVLHQLWFTISFDDLLCINEQAQCREVRCFKMLPVWEFFDNRKPGWLKFSRRMTEVLEDRCGMGISELELVIQGCKMVVDFKRMRCQQSKGEFLAMRHTTVQDTEEEPHALEPPPEPLSPGALERHTTQLQATKLRLAPKILDGAGGLADKPLDRAIPAVWLLQQEDSPSTATMEEAGRQESFGLTEKSQGRTGPNRSSKAGRSGRGGWGDTPSALRRQNSAGDLGTPTAGHGGAAGDWRRRKVSAEELHVDAEIQRRRNARGRGVRRADKGAFGSSVILDTASEGSAPHTPELRKPLGRQGSDLGRGRKTGSPRGRPSPRSSSHPPEIALSRGLPKAPSSKPRGRQRSLGTSSVDSRQISLRWMAQARVDCDNLNHQPGGGNVRIWDEKLQFRQRARPRVDDNNIHHAPGGGRVKIFSEKLEFRRRAQPRVDDNNLDHAPGGGNVRIINEKLDFRRRARPKVDDDNLAHAPGGGDVCIVNARVDFRRKARPKVDARTALDHSSDTRSSFQETPTGRPRAAALNRRKS